MRRSASEAATGRAFRDVIVVAGLRTCDTCRKAVRALEAAGSVARLRDLRDEPVGSEELETWRDAFGVDVLLNRRSTTWRSLTEDERDGDPIDLMTTHPALVRRPVIIREGEAPLLGWTDETRAALGVR